MLLENGQLKACTYDPIKDETTIRLVLPGKQADDDEARGLAQQTDLEVSITSAQQRIDFSTRDQARAAIEKAMPGQAGEDLPFTDEIEDDQGEEGQVLSPRQQRTADPARRIKKATLAKLQALHDELVSKCHKPANDLFRLLETGYNVQRYEDLKESQGLQAIIHWEEMRDGFLRADLASDNGRALAGRKRED